MKVIIRAALVAAVIATLVGSGAASAASHLITGKEIKDNSVTGRDIKNRSVTSGDLTDGAIDVLSGAQGPQGPAGPVGAQGPAATVGIVSVVSPHQVMQPGQYTSMRADCPPGMTVVGTGFNTGIGNADFVLSYGTFVGGFVDNDVSIPIEAWVQALCASGVGNGGGTARSVVRSDAVERFTADVAAARASH
jgi:hypothetical protein